MAFQPVDRPASPVVGDRHPQLGVPDHDPGEGQPRDLVPRPEVVAEPLPQPPDGGLERRGAGEVDHVGCEPLHDLAQSLSQRMHAATAAAGP